MLSRRLSFYIAGFGILAAIVLVSKLSFQKPPPPPPLKPAVTPYANTISATGIVESINENISLGVPAPGLVSEVHVKVWDHVKKDQPLFSLDSRDLVARLHVEIAQVKVSDATMIRLRDQLRRLEAVNDVRAVSADEVATRKNDVRVAEAQVQVARHQVIQTRDLIERLTVKAPRDGMILQSNIRAGEYVSVTSGVIAMVLGDIDQLQIRADVDEQNAPGVKADKPAIAFLKGVRTNPMPLRFVRIEPMVIPKKSLTGASDERVDTRVLQIIYAFDQTKDSRVYVGQQVDVFIEADPAKIGMRK